MTKAQDEPRIHTFIQWAIIAAERPGYFTRELKKIADHLFLEEENFVLAVLHGHLLVEKALNHLLATHSVPAVLLTGEEGLTFKQKYETYCLLVREHDYLRKFFKVANRLRNNVAHEFWEPRTCLDNAFTYAYQSKKDAESIRAFSSVPLETTKWFFTGLLNTLGALDTLEEHPSTG